MILSRLPLMLLLLMMTGLSGSGCGTSRGKTETTAPRSAPDFDRSADDRPLTDRDFTGRDSTVSPSTPSPAPPAEFPVRPDTVTTSRSLKQTAGYRIQIHSFLDREAAYRAQKTVTVQLRDMGLQVYVEEEAPYYKVRIGDYLSRTKAEADLVILKTRKGYPDAWIAKTMIFSQDR